MAVKPFFDDSESSYFDARGRPARPGLYEFRRHDGMKILYTLDWMEREAGEEPRLRVVRCSRLADFPSPAHALNTLDGTWVRWLGPGETGGNGESPATDRPTGGEGKRRILVAGAGGAVGRRLCPLLVAEGWSVIGTTRSAGKIDLLRGLGAEPVVVDVFDQARLIDVVREARPEIVIHQLTDLPPGLDPSKMAEARVRNARLREIGTRHLVAAAAAAGVKRMVAQSIAFAYAPGPMPYREEAPLNVDHPDLGATARAVASLESQVLEAPFEGIVLRYGKFYGPGTGFAAPPSGGPVHVDAAADAARLAAVRGGPGIYNIAEEDGTVSSSKAIASLGWDPGFRISGSPGRFTATA